MYQLISTQTTCKPFTQGPPQGLSGIHPDTDPAPHPAVYHPVFQLFVPPAPPSLRSPGPFPTPPALFSRLCLSRTGLALTKSIHTLLTPSSQSAARTSAQQTVNSKAIRRLGMGPWRGARKNEPGGGKNGLRGTGSPRLSPLLSQVPGSGAPSISLLVTC